MKNKHPGYTTTPKERLSYWTYGVLIYCASCCFTDALKTSCADSTSSRLCSGATSHERGPLHPHERGGHPEVYVPPPPRLCEYSQYVSAIRSSLAPFRWVGVEAEKQLSRRSDYFGD